MRKFYYVIVKVFKKGYLDISYAFHNKKYINKHEVHNEPIRHFLSKEMFFSGILKQLTVNEF